MQNSWLIPLMALASMANFFSSVVEATETAPYVMLNNGLIESNKACSTDEWNLVMSEMETATGQRRELRGEGGSNRQLGRCGCRYCWFKSGCARDIDLRKLSSSPSGQRRLESCDVGIGAIDNTLNALGNSSNLSPNCKALVNSPRAFTCNERVECDINHVNLWNADTEEMMVEDFPSTGGSLCQSAWHSFEAVPTFDYGNVHFRLSTAGTPSLFSRTDWIAPYFMYGNGNGYQYVNGGSLEVGNYTLHVTSNDPVKGKAIQFEVTGC